jgi:predicted Zn-dependent protease
VRASVTENDVPQTVSFDVGLVISQTFNNMGLEFTLEAPDNLTVQNQLATMSTEERGKLALTMLATGLYLAEGNSSSGFNVNSALNAFLQSEISNIAGSALKSIDISVGVEDGTTATGASTTDYSFRFAKRFWNNRVSVIVGGKVSTGKEVESADQTFIDNVSLEYRLDNGGTRYVRLFYDKDVEDLLEGNLSEAGAGLVLRKKMDKLSDLFIFRKTKTQ